MQVRSPAVPATHCPLPTNHFLQGECPHEPCGGERIGTMRRRGYRGGERKHHRDGIGDETMQGCGDFMKELTDVDKPENQLAGIIIEASIEVHREMGSGLLESVYLTCLSRELSGKGLNIKREVVFPVYYKGRQTDQVLRIDLLVEDLVVVEIKSSIDLQPLFLSQLKTYLKITDKRLGLLINFNVPILKEGIRRVVNGL
jgi:GxxExxY protein